MQAVARDAEPLGFGLPPRRVAAFCAHPAWVRPYLRCATFKAWLVAAREPGAGRTAAAVFARAGSGRRAGAGVARLPSAIINANYELTVGVLRPSKVV